ncbi:hypothetical protein LIER_35683 [Lithospermum erythrorhizon]|uniref:Phytosulfokine n=1 Tax=Lithospermum erythrorhizon TaxID=34254 RepID=A0AAV3NVW0_LITER
MIKHRSATHLFFLVLLLALSALTCGSRHVSSLLEAQEHKGENIGVRNEVVGERRLCEGVVDDDECLMMRRTLVAHLDYIYTQKEKP